MVKVKEYLELCEKKTDAIYKAREYDLNDDFNNYAKERKEADKLIKKIDDLKNCYVSFNIGSRSYYEKVIKIGKGYYNHGRKMTKGRGYWDITEIPEITDKMKQDMIADSYYY